ncbi:hypothetical protein IQ251_16030 [Saccharopolyspora sp. HNM0983]|uniref:Uncharacterized protein n=1 Tax=Saccharopolyspora montiporae TaxID=2781240 RepID=A0A929BBY8_9PSEU|nr:DUF6153 family protein [Saccharopolyspora sp. HNM0983]MBE9375960.1 hypothetical protein [Saccharopolyspora sp. HNM0983]
MTGTRGSTAPAGRGMLARWLLLLALSAGMVLMHHVPGGHGEHHSPAAAASTEHGAAPPAHAAPDPAAPAHAAADQTGGEPGPVQLDDLLHLCLAIIAGAALLLLDLRRNRGPLHGLPTIRTPRVHPVSRRRPPPPVRRRLAELCVLRL